LRFLLLFSPRWLFLYPGFVLFVFGLAMTAWLLPGGRSVAGVVFDIHSLLYASIAIVIGFQSMQFWTFAKIYGMREGIVPPDPSFQSLIGIATFETGLIAGAILLLIGLLLGAVAVGAWSEAGLGVLRPSETMRLVIPSATAILLAFQIFYGACFVSLLEIRATRKPSERAEDAPAA
jgi:hypothetical protein